MQLYRIKGSQLRAIRINDFDPNDLAELPIIVMPGKGAFKVIREQCYNEYQENKTESWLERNIRLENAVDSAGR